MQGKVRVEDFYIIEAMNVEFNPNCVNCKCDRYPLGGTYFSFKGRKRVEFYLKGIRIERRWLGCIISMDHRSRESPRQLQCSIKDAPHSQSRLMKNIKLSNVYKIYSNGGVALTLS